MTTSDPRVEAERLLADVPHHSKGEFVRALRALLASTAQPAPGDDREALARAWDAGHKHWWRRGPDECRCAAWSSSECACGEYGTGELLSLQDNPFRRAPTPPTEPFLTLLDGRTMTREEVIAVLPDADPTPPTEEAHD